MATGACLSTLFEKISPPPDKHLRKDIPSAVAFCVLGLYRKTEL